MTAADRPLTMYEAVTKVAYQSLGQGRAAMREPTDARELAMAVGALWESCRALLALLEGKDPYGYDRD